MALSSNLLSSSSHFATNNPKETLQIGNQKNLIKFSSLRSTGKWSISNDNNLVFTSLKSYNADRYPYSNDDTRVEHGKRLNLFKHMLGKVEQDPLQRLAMIDAVQRLGIDHYFLEEIEQILQMQYDMLPTSYGGRNKDLHGVSLLFRLLRQQGFHASPDAFINFKNEEGKFDKNVSEDIKGLMSLYEASQLSIPGEDVLDEAQVFSSQALHEWTTRLHHHQARVVKNALEHPYHKSLATFTAKNVFIDFNGASGWMNVLQELAKIDCNMVQSLHQDEIIQISKWWKEVGLAKELKFARDQPLKWYVWSAACFADPSLSKQRVELTKAISFIYLIDDIFDVYGTLDELILFTQAVNRWDLAAVEQLPDYLKECFRVLDDVTNEISYEVYKDCGWDPSNSLRKTWASLCNAFLVEAKWFASGQLPKAEEYLKNGAISSGVHVVLVHAFFLLGHGFTNHTVKLVENNPPIVSWTATILRLWDDLGSAKDEDQDGHDGSYVECYMKENKGSSIEDARNKITHLIANAWKQLNQECLSPNPFSTNFIKASLNIARMVPLMYSYDDNHCLPSLEEYMKSHLFESSSL